MAQGPWAQGPGPRAQAPWAHGPRAQGPWALGPKMDVIIVLQKHDFLKRHFEEIALFYDHPGPKPGRK